MDHGHDGGSTGGSAAAAAAPALDRPDGPEPHGAAGGHVFDPSILRAYDIRGTVGRSLTAEDAYHVGRTFATVLARRGGGRAVLGFDGRLSSPALADAVRGGLAAGGIHVLDLGLATSPMTAFAAEALGADATVMVTGSHNPPTHNGVKLAIGGAPFFGEDIAGLGRIAALADYVTGSGRVETHAVTDAYVERLAAEAASERPLTIAWDPGNGAAGPVAERLAAALPGRHVVINAAVDGTFPAHHPDPSRPENLRQLADVVVAERCDLGIAFDGDGDRIGVVDRNGRPVAAEQLLMLFARAVLAEKPGACVISDVKTSQGVFDLIASLGGRPSMSPTGHSPIRAAMQRTGALLAGDVSGHFFFADRYGGYDDAAYAAVRLLGLLSASGEDLARAAEALPSAESTPEIRLPCPDSRKFDIVERVAKALAAAGGDVVALDGVRVNIGAGSWWLLRASNTEGALTVRCEGRDRLGLDQAKHALIAALRDAGVKVDLAALFQGTA